MLKLLYFKASLVLIFSLQTLPAHCCSTGGASTRLQAFCFTNELAGRSVDKRQIQILDYLFKREGYSDGLGLATILGDNSVKYFASPVVDYQSNINGGNPDKPLVLGSLYFEGERERIRKKGIVAGALIGLNGRKIVDQGRYMDVLIKGSLMHSLDHDLYIAQNSASFCSKNYVEKNWYIDSCVTSARTKKEFTDSVVQTASFGLAQLFSMSGQSYHEISAGVMRRFEDSYTQNQLILGLDTIHQNGLFTGTYVTIAEPLEGVLSTKFIVNAKFGMALFDRAASLSIRYSKSENGKVLDFDMKEVTKSVNVNYALYPWLTVSLGYSDTNSNIDFFDYTEPSFGIEFTPFEF